MSKTPLLDWGQKSPELTTDASSGGRGSDAGANLSGDKDQKQLAPSHAKKTGGPALNSDEKPNQGRGEAGVLPHSHSIPQGQKFTADALSDLAMRLGGAKLAEAFAKSLPKKPLNDGKKRKGEAAELDVDMLRYQSSVFALLSRHTTMAVAAAAFSLAVERFASGKDNKKRVSDTKLSKAGMALSAAANRAPHSEAIFATLATRLTGDAQLLLLSDAKPVPLRSRWRRWRWPSAASDGAGRISRIERLLAATISSPEPTLPVHTAKGSEKELKLIDKHQIMYAVAVMLPVSLLASAAGIRVFAGQGAWAAGLGVCMWTVASTGMVLNQYGKLNWELVAARHLNRLCLLGGAVLLSFYAFKAYLPAEKWALWLLIGIAVTVLGVPWVISTIRGDDVITVADAADMVDRAGKTTGDGQDDLN